MSRCSKCKQEVPEKPRVEVITVDGISYKRFHWKDGLTVESPCKCFGALYRAHSTSNCPWLKKRNAPMQFKEAVALGVKMMKGTLLEPEKRELYKFMVRPTFKPEVFNKAVVTALEIDARPGCVKFVKSRSTGLVVGLYKAAEAGIESDPETPWATVCEEHAGVVCHPTRAAAEAYLGKPDEWCPTCQENRDNE